MLLFILQIDNPDLDLADVVNYPNVRTFYTDLQSSDTPLSDLKAVHRNWAAPTAGMQTAFFLLKKRSIVWSKSLHCR